MMDWRGILAAALAMTALSGPATAQSDRDVRVCNGQEDVSLETRMAHCNVIINTPGLRPEVLANAYNNRGGVYYYLKDIARALADYDRAIALNPKSSSAFNNRCWSRAVAGRAQEAVADCNRALELEPGVGNTYENRGFAHLKLKNHDAAFADYSEALRIDGPRSDLLYGRGLARVRRGDAGGEADIAAAKQLNPKIAEEFASYGLI
jgi:tetratricopeptide (TPR) repeat protein